MTDAELKHYALIGLRAVQRDVAAKIAELDPPTPSAHVAHAGKWEKVDPATISETLKTMAFQFTRPTPAATVAPKRQQLPKSSRKRG